MLPWGHLRGEVRIFKYDPVSRIGGGRNAEDPKAGDFGSREGMTNDCVVDEALRMTVGKPAKMLELRQMANPGAKQACAVSAHAPPPAPSSP